MDVKKKDPIYAINKIPTLNIKTQVKRERMEKDTPFKHLSKENGRDYITRDKERHFVTIRGVSSSRRHNIYRVLLYQALCIVCNLIFVKPYK